MTVVMMMCHQEMEVDYDTDDSGDGDDGPYDSPVPDMPPLMRHNDNDDDAAGTVVVEDVLDDDETDADITPKVVVEQLGRS